MDHDEYGERLRAFGSHVSAARTHNRILEEMVTDDPDTLGILNTYAGFFVYVKAALHNGMLLAAAKSLDRDPRTASLPNLVNAAKESPELAPEVDLTCIEKWLKMNALLIDDLIVLRNKRLAHYDVTDVELPGGLQYGAFADLLDGLHKHLVTLERAFHDVAAIIDDRVEEARAHTREVRQVLLNDRRDRLAASSTD